MQSIPCSSKYSCKSTSEWPNTPTVLPDLSKDTVKRQTQLFNSGKLREGACNAPSSSHCCRFHKFFTPAVNNSSTPWAVHPIMQYQRQTVVVLVFPEHCCLPGTLCVCSRLSSNSGQRNGFDFGAGTVTWLCTVRAVVTGLPSWSPSGETVSMMMGHCITAHFLTSTTPDNTFLCPAIFCRCGVFYHLQVWQKCL